MTYSDINPINKRQRERLKEYQAIKLRWRAQPANFRCAFPGCTKPADESPHHTRGHLGLLLCDVRYWIAICRKHHNWIHSNIEAARALNLICELGKWGKSDRFRSSIK